jgi:hypothetical protein
MTILQVLTSHNQLGNTGRKTCFWLEEFAAPYFVFKKCQRRTLAQFQDSACYFRHRPRLLFCAYLPACN